MKCGMIFRREKKKKTLAEQGGGGAREKDYEMETKVSDYKRGRKRKLVTNCKSSLAALTDRPIIARAYLEAKPG